MLKNTEPRWVQNGPDASYEIPNVAEAIITPNQDAFEVVIFDLEKQETASPLCIKKSYHSRGGAKRAAIAALKRLVLRKTAVKPEPEAKPATSIWTLMAQETVVRGKGLEIPCIVRPRGEIWEATATLGAHEFYAEFEDEISAKHAVLQFTNKLIDWYA